MPNILNKLECPIKLRVCHQNESCLLRPNPPLSYEGQSKEGSSHLGETLSIWWNFAESVEQDRSGHYWLIDSTQGCLPSGPETHWALGHHKYADLCMAVFLLFFRLWWAEYFTLLTTTCISTLGSSSPASVGSPARAGPITTGELRWGSSSRTSKCRRSSLDSTSPWPF